MPFKRPFGMADSLPPGFVDSMGQRVSLGAQLKTNHAVALRTVLCWALMTLCIGAAETEKQPGIGLAIVYDTSGSMKDVVEGSNKAKAPKFQIANRALLAVVDKLEKFQKANPAQALRTSLVVFEGDSGRLAVPFEDFDPKKFRAWIQNFGTPNGATPLGAAMRTAAQPLMEGKLQRSHILVVTDGANTAGPEPAAVIPGLRAAAGKAGIGLSIHFIAFDVEARVFEPLKKLNVTLLSAANEKQLDSQLTLILERKILLEDEEAAPPVKNP